MKEMVFKTASFLNGIDDIIGVDMSRYDRIALKITKQAAIPRVVGQFAQVLSKGIKMRPKDMQDMDKVKDKFVKLFNLYYTWIMKVKEQESGTKKKSPLVNYFAKVFSKQIDNFIETLTVSEEDGGPGWGRLNVNEVAEFAAKESKLPAGWRGENFGKYGFVEEDGC